MLAPTATPRQTVRLLQIEGFARLAAWVACSRDVEAPVAIEEFTRCHSAAHRVSGLTVSSMA